MREYTNLRRERREMSRNDIDVGENVPAEHQPMPTEATPMIEDPESTPKFSVGNYVTVLPLSHNFLR